jgi:hypothetical protein
MLSYEIDGSVLTLRGSGTITLQQRLHLFAAVRADAGVPNGALVLLDVRGIDVDLHDHAVIERTRVLVDQLGPKLGPACAIIIPLAPDEQSRIYQDAASDVGLRVRFFRDEPSARQWLNAFR